MAAPLARTEICSCCFFVATHSAFPRKGTWKGGKVKPTNIGEAASFLMDTTALRVATMQQWAAPKQLNVLLRTLDEFFPHIFVSPAGETRPWAPGDDAAESITRAYKRATKFVHPDLARGKEPAVIAEAQEILKVLTNARANPMDTTAASHPSMMAPPSSASGFENIFSLDGAEITSVIDNLDGSSSAIFRAVSGVRASVFEQGDVRALLNKRLNNPRLLVRTLVFLSQDDPSGARVFLYAESGTEKAIPDKLIDTCRKLFKEEGSVSKRQRTENGAATTDAAPEGTGVWGLTPGAHVFKAQRDIDADGAQATARVCQFIRQVGTKVVYAATRASTTSQLANAAAKAAAAAVTKATIVHGESAAKTMVTNSFAASTLRNAPPPSLFLGIEGPSESVQLSGGAVTTSFEAGAGVAAVPAGGPSPSATPHPSGGLQEALNQSEALNQELRDALAQSDALNQKLRDLVLQLLASPAEHVKACVEQPPQLPSSNIQPGEGPEAFEAWLQETSAALGAPHTSYETEEKDRAAVARAKSHSKIAQSPKLLLPLHLRSLAAFKGSILRAVGLVPDLKAFVAAVSRELFALKVANITLSQRVQKQSLASSYLSSSTTSDPYFTSATALLLTTEDREHLGQLQSVVADCRQLMDDVPAAGGKGARTSRRANGLQILSFCGLPRVDPSENQTADVAGVAVAVAIVRVATMGSLSPDEMALLVLSAVEVGAAHPPPPRVTTADALVVQSPLQDDARCCPTDKQLDAALKFLGLTAKKADDGQWEQASTLAHCINTNLVLARSLERAIGAYPALKIPGMPRRAAEHDPVCQVDKVVSRRSSLWVNPSVKQVRRAIYRHRLGLYSL